MIKLIVGLGNPGQQYEKTRHNAGFLFLDCLIQGLGVEWTKVARFDCMLLEVIIGGCKVIMLKPDTFMNRSGHAVGKVARYYKIKPEEILVVHDELDFETGMVKLKKDGGHAGHNGLRDIIANLATKEFYRLRIGIGRPPAGKAVADFVLSNPSKNECIIMSSVFDIAARYIVEMVSGDVLNAMNKMNSHKFIN